MSFDLSNLRSLRQPDVDRIFNDVQLEEAWQSAEPELRTFEIPDGTGGVNPGDQRAVFYLTLHLRARSVLEIGTHIGSSTTHIAAALRAIERSIEPGSVRLDSVDVLDVNHVVRRPWLNYGTRLSPREMIRCMDLDRFVQFVSRPSVYYMARCQRKYDLIFLDGDHSEEVVYQEVPAALGLLNPGGVILLHDYFPDARPLWSNGSVIDGPWRAVQRMQREGVAARALPLGALPWPTKCASSVTSLAIFARA